MKKQISALAGGLLLSIASSSAAVIVYFEQVGPNVEATWTGTLDVSSSYSHDGAWGSSGGDSGADRFYTSVPGTFDSYSGTATDVGMPTVPGWQYHADHTGDIGGLFGVISNFCFPAPDDNTANHSIIDFNSAVYKVILASNDLATIGAAAFNNTLAWTAASSGDTISYTTGPAVPEPSTALLLGLLAVVGLAVRRRC